MTEQPSQPVKAAARFESVAVRAAPGFADGGLRFESLAPGVNVIYGPNGSGKSTTARTLHQLLWPRDIDCDALSAHSLISVGDDRWHIDVNFGRLKYQCNGVDRETVGPMLPAADARFQYQLALHDLLHDDDHDFAAKLQQEAAGGCDLPKAAQDLGFTADPKRPLALRRRLETAERAVHAATQAQAGLKQRQDRIDDLRRQLDDARKAQRQIERIKTAQHIRELHTRLADANRKFESFPQSMSKITGREIDQLDKMRTQLGKYRDGAQGAQREIAEALAAIESAKLPDDGIPQAKLESLRSQAGELKRLHQQCSSLAQQAANEAGKRDSLAAGQPLGVAQDMQDCLRKIEQSTIGHLERLAQAFDNATKQRTQITQQLEDLGHAADQPAPQVDESKKETLQNGLRVLASVLQQIARSEGEKQGRQDLLDSYAAETGTAGPHDEAPPRTTDFTPNHLQSAIMVIAVAIILLLSVGRGVEYWLVALGLAVVAIWSFVWQRQTVREERRRTRAAADAITKVDRLSPLVAEYEQLSLPRPAHWSIDDVSRLLSDLGRQLVQAERDVQNAEQIARLLKMKVDADRAYDQAATAWRDMLRQCGISKDATAGEHLWLVLSLTKWAAADAEYAGLSKQLGEAESQHAKLLTAINEQLAQWCDHVVTSADDAMGVISDLANREHARRNAHAKLEAAKGREKSASDESKRCAGEIEDVFTQLSLEPGDDVALRDLINQHAAYHKAAQHAGECATELRLTSDRLRDVAGDAYEALVASDEIDLARQLDQATQQAGQAETLHEQLVDLESEIRSAQQGSTLQDALAERESAAEALRDQRSFDIDAVIGQLLVDRLQKQAREHDQPLVFKHARQLFSRITRGRYELAFDIAGGAPTFYAIDTQTECGHTMEQLSSGTRLQLLLAVRLAFVELQEPGVMLPLVLDETLGNSDDTRANEIVAAVISIAQTGRQVFYFTAQADEAGKWQHALAATGRDDWRIIQLLDCRDKQSGMPAPMPIAPVASLPAIPQPEGLDRVAYGRLLGVPPINPHHPVGSVHLWYLVRDCDTLHRLLSVVRIETWGQLRSLVECGGMSWAGDRRDWKCIAARAAALQVAISAWRIGRGTPVTRQALENSGAVSSNFLDRVVELCDEVGGDAMRLIEGLDVGKVSGFRKNKRDDLELYLIDNRFIDTADTLSDADVRLRVMAAIEDDIANDFLTADDADELISYVLAGSPGFASADQVASS